MICSMLIMNLFLIQWIYRTILYILIITIKCIEMTIHCINCENRWRHHCVVQISFVKKTCNCDEFIFIFILFLRPILGMSSTFCCSSNKKIPWFSYLIKWFHQKSSYRSSLHDSSSIFSSFVLWAILVYHLISNKFNIIQHRSQNHVLFNWVMD